MSIYIFNPFDLVGITSLTKMYAIKFDRLFLNDQNPDEIFMIFEKVSGQDDCQQYTIEYCGRSRPEVAWPDGPKITNRLKMNSFLLLSNGASEWITFQ